MEIIDLCSDGEDDTKSRSDGEDITPLGLGRKDNLGSDDPSDGVNRSLVLLNTPFGQNNGKQPINLDDDDWLSSTHASSSYRSPAVSSHRIYPLSSSSVRLHDSSYSNSLKVLAENDDDDIYMYSVPPQSFPTSHSSLNDIMVKEDLTAKFDYFGSSAANGTGMASSTMSADWKLPFGSSQKVKTDSDNDDVYAYEGPRAHRIFPPSMPSWNSVDGAEVLEHQNVETDSDNDDVDTYEGPSHRMFPPSMPSWNSVDGAEGLNGFGTQSHPNVENRPSSCDERAIYEEALQHISQERREEDLPEGVMSISLLKHQKIALAWMLSKENSSHCPGGILADDQGLGKTISTISLIQKERVQQSNFMSADSDSKSSVSLDLDEDDTVTIMDKKEMKGEPSDRLASNLELCAQSGTAVNSVVKTVEVEPKKKTRARLPSSASALRSATRPSAGTLVVCPASILKQWASEISAKVTESSKLSVLVYHGGSRTRDPNQLAKYDVVVTTYAIVGQEVPKQDSDDDDMEQKNSEKYGICPDFCAGNKRKLPKGTKKKASKKKKLNSSDTDLEGGPLARVRWFRVVLDEAQTIKNHRTKSARACCGLRAKRRWCLSGTPMQNTIDDLYSYFRFLKYEPYSDYGSFKSMIKNPISKGRSQGYKKLQTVLKIVLLRRTKETLLDGEPIIKIPTKTIKLEKINFTQEERYFYLALEEGSRQEFKKFAAAGTIKQNYANILVLLLRLRQACDHPFLLKEDNHANLTNPGSIERAKQLPREIVINLLEKLEVRHLVCLICAKERQYTRQKEQEPPENAVITTCCHVFCYECVLESLSEEEVCPCCKQKLSAESVFSRPVLRLCLSDDCQSNATTSCAAPVDESAAAEDESSSICEKSYISSKVQAAVDTLNRIFKNDTIETSPSEIAPSKAIVFSQWTGMLDVLELSLNSNLITFRRLDGSMSLDVRGAAVEEFKTDPEVRVMLMSLKAGNLGLNMIAACHVIMLDPWWNPYAEDQAVDRAHRIGQTRPVTVTRFTVNGTVEDRILALQAKKREMVESAFGDEISGGIATRLTVEDLGYLFNI